MKRLSVNISLIGKLLRLGKYSTISFEENVLHLHGINESSTSITLDKIETFNIDVGIIWSKFEVVLIDGPIYTADGFSKTQAKNFYSNFSEVFAEQYYTFQYSKAKKVLSSMPSSEEYFQTRAFNSLVSLAKKEMGKFKFLPVKENPQYTKTFLNILSLLKEDTSLQKKYNDAFIKLELEKYKNFFDTVEKNPLTQKQREAVVVNEKSNLVIAGAGSGKTSVMVGRVGYVLQKYGLLPSEILVVAFGNTAAKELSDRIEERLNLKGIDVSTFHSFGQNVIAVVEGKKPSLAPWVEDANQKAKIVEEILQELSERDSKFKKILLDFFAYPFAQYKSEFNFKTKIEYLQYMQENKIVALRGDPVKSYEECEIANFLFLNGINYEYEPFYKHETATVEHRQYQPDFYLPDYDIYLEHFGIDKNGNTAPFVPQEPYHKGMKWKREIHKQYETKLLETYSYYQQEGRLLHKLEDMLLEEGVEMSSRSIIDALKFLNENTLVSEFSKTIATFIGHYKSNDHTMPKIRSRAGSSERLNAFLDLFEPILGAYETKKNSLGVIDFDDMISKAIHYIEDGRYKSNYKCILVDEYQDISTARARLIKALYKQVDDSVLTVVGDDWQSIYRFAGSEISLFHYFEKEFGFSKKVKLDYTFRYNDKISSVSQKFIEANPNQIKKEIKTLTQVESPTVHVWWGDDKDLMRVKQILSDIQTRKQGVPFSVFLLGRNRYSFPENYKSLSSSYPTLDITTLTVHRSKGLEADITIIPGVCSGRLGFPSSIQGDPILDLALAEEEDFDYAEERRLFYVAITRAKEEVHILASDTNVSSFARELEEDQYNVMHHYKDNIKPQRCPKCNVGTLVIRTGQNGKFWGCSNYGNLKCDYSAPIYFCKEDSCSGIMQFDKNKKMYLCSEKNSNHTEKACPSCDGMLLMRFNKRQNNRPFYGCSNFSKMGCSYTEAV
ncbi:UvrD-helicase domain-containing protein [Sulfurovum sp. XGS-02]|uniref:UvrD-helicase domain-containing protein n=1 Tax=Sulfurovum sp. XGS-02 TaxID=2925411 RepID=UPI00206291AA|nr:UvrD-helicase domain-containing protein [Sulfurovum sp. XGS-02]UPT76677.1 UvrD-helicase domain-containing protein [Sulfurovum sp. XGS-02]